MTNYKIALYSYFQPWYFTVQIFKYSYSSCTSSPVFP